MTLERVAGAGAAVLVALGLVAGFAVIGSPRHMRAVEADERRIDDLRALATQIDFAYARGARRPSRPLPATLPRAIAAAARSDALTGRPYAYQREGERRYRLCATFETALGANDGATWPHRAGARCFRFDLDADPDRAFPPPEEVAQHS